MKLDFETNPYLILYSVKLRATAKLPDALLDPPQGETEIRARWTEVDGKKNDGLGTTDYERRHYNDKLGEVKAALLDGGAGTRKKHIEAARKEIEHRFLELLAEYASGGGKDLPKTILDRVALTFKRWLTSATAEKVAKAAGYRIVEGAPGPKETPLPVPKKPADWPDKLAREEGVIDKAIPEYLSFLSTYEKRPIRDVYEFLNARPTSPLATLQNGLHDAKGRYSTQNSSMVNKTPHLQAAASLFRVLDDVLKSEASRRHWERCWALAQIDAELRPIFMTRIAGGKVSADDYLGAVEKCREKGLSAADAEYYAYEYYVVEKKCPMPARVADEKPREAVRFCGACHAANAKGAKNCTHCGVPLDVVCPNCKNNVDYGDGNCPHCGFAVGDMPLALPLIEEAKDALGKNDLPTASAKVQRALELWPENEEAVRVADAVKQRVKVIQGIAEAERAAKEAAQKEAERETARQRFRKALKEDLDAAEKMLPELARTGVKEGELQDLKGKLACARFEKALGSLDFKAAESWLEEASRNGGDPQPLQRRLEEAKGRKAQTIEKALRLALERGNADEAERQLGLWRAAGGDAGKAARYEAQIEQRREDDRKARVAALVSGLRGAAKVEARQGREGVALLSVTWEGTRGGSPVAGWRVYRKEGHGGEAKPLKDVGPSAVRVEDSGVKYGVRYVYGVVPLASVPTPDGGTEMAEGTDEARWSEAAGCVVPFAANALRGHGEGVRGRPAIVELSWQLPEGLPSSAGDVKMELERRGAGGWRREVDWRKGYCEDRGVEVGRTYEYTATLSMCGVRAGISRVQVAVQEIRPPEGVIRLRFAEKGRRVKAEWEWPAGVDAAEWAVMERPVRNASEVPVPRRNHVNRSGGTQSIWVAVPQGECWLAVWGVHSGGGRKMESPVECLRLQETRVRWELERSPWTPAKERSRLVLTTTTGFFPAMEVHAGSEVDVLSPDGGRNALTLGPIEGQMKTETALTGVVARGEHIRLYLVQDERENCLFDEPKKNEVK